MMIAMAFNVFVEGAVSSAPNALEDLAQAMSKRYGLQVADLVTRMSRGRFRVKSNVDTSTAERYRKDLESIGARVLIEDAAMSPTATPVAGVPVTRPAEYESEMALGKPGVRAAVTTPRAEPVDVALGRAGAGASTAPPTRQRPPTPVPLGTAGAGPRQHERPSTPVALGNAGARPTPPPNNMTVAGFGNTREPARPTTPTPPAANMTVAGFGDAREPAAPARPTPQPANATVAGFPTQTRAPANTATPPGGTPLPPRPAPSSPLAGMNRDHPRPSTPPSALAGYAVNREHARPSTPVPSSGLAAAFTDQGDARESRPDLGALGDEGMLSLSSLDGQEAAAAAPQFDLPPEPIAPAVTFAPKAKAAAPRKKPGPSKAMDLFAPPDAGDQDFSVDLAAEEVAERAQKKATAPAVEERAAPPGVNLPSMRRPPPLEHQMPGGMALPGLARGPFVATVFIALVLGFIPVHFVAAWREKSAYAAIDNRVKEAQASADTLDTYMALDGFREKAIDDKTSARQKIALMSILLWAVISAGLGYAFQRYSPTKK